MAYGGSRGRSTKRKHKNRLSIPKVILAVLILCAAIALIVFGFKFVKGKIDEAKVIETLEPEEKLENSVKVDGISIGGMGKTQAKLAIEKKYAWDMIAKLAGGNPSSYEIGNLLDYSINKTLDEVYSSAEPQAEYTINFEINDADLNAEIEAMKALWNVEAKNGSISGFDKETEEFTFSGAEKGYGIDEEKLRNDIRTAFAAKKYNAKIDVSGSEVEPEISKEQAKEMYKTIGTYTTKSTNNADRNSNLNLACNAIDGLVLQVGEEFSFNMTTGNRTAEKGYKEAAAYSNGEVVSEPGGGVCQVASTLYNAVIFSGLEVTERHAHTYAPTYVTPGEDATVSYDGYTGPDLRFTNTSSAALVIRAHYENRTVTCSVIGIPILPEGEVISMHSEKIADSDVPEPTYEDDPTLEAGVQILVSAGDQGSTWNTYITHTVNGVVVSDELFHVSKYSGHKPKIRRNESLWDPSFDVIPTDENGETTAPITYTNEAGETLISHTKPEETTEAEADERVVEDGPGGSPVKGTTAPGNSNNNAPGNTQETIPMAPNLNN